VGTTITFSTVFVGIDVSKDTLGCCLVRPAGSAKEAVFPNDTKGFAALAAWADRYAAGAAIHFCLEATSPYSEAVATHLAGGGRLVSVVNSTRVKYAGLMTGRGNKTDKADARLIAAYAARERPAAWVFVAAALLYVTGSIQQATPGDVSVRCRSLWEPFPW
jgi:transposase